MAKSTYPFVVSDPVLRSCRRGRHRVAEAAMCHTHTRTCLTCCGRLKRDCGLPIQKKLAAISEKDFNEAYINTPGPMTWEERQAELARIRQQLGFRPLTADEIEENAKWRVW